MVLGVAACGPGLEAVHESNLRFEHCYRLDMDPRIAATHREHCWRDWTVEYGYDQPLDHIEYARRRIVALESGDTRLVSLRTDAPSEGRVFEEVGSAPADAPMAAPAPTSVNAPPPKTEPVARPEPAPAPAASARPGDACTAECESPLTECTKRCGKKQADCATCREDYRRCMRRCFE